jgi:hypothetical protein
MAIPRCSILNPTRRKSDNIGEMYNWVLGPLLKAVEDYKATLIKYPNPPAANMTRF